MAELPVSEISISSRDFSHLGHGVTGSCHNTASWNIQLLKLNFDLVLLCVLKTENYHFKIPKGNTSVLKTKSTGLLTCGQILVSNWKVDGFEWKKQVPKYLPSAFKNLLENREKGNAIFAMGSKGITWNFKPAEQFFLSIKTLSCTALWKLARARPTDKAHWVF